MSNSGLLSGVAPAQGRPGQVNAARGWTDHTVNSTGSNYAVSTSLNGSTSAALSSYLQWWTPFWWPVDVRATAIGLKLVTVGTAGAGDPTCRLGIYSSDHQPQPPGRQRPGRLLLDAGTLDLTATTGWREIAIDLPLIGGQVYWAAFHHGLTGTNPTITTCGWATHTSRHQFGWDLIGLIADNGGRYTPVGYSAALAYAAGFPSWTPPSAALDGAGSTAYAPPLIAIKTVTL